MSFLYLLRLYSLVFALLLPSLIVGEGFVAGTLVCTPQGHIPIEDLVVGDEVMTSDLNFYKVEPITHVTCHVVKEYVRIKIKDVVIDVAADHRFLLPGEQRWEQAGKLRVGACLVGAPINAEFIDCVEKIRQPSCVYTLSLKTYHTYLVSERNIMVHNNDAGSLALEFVKGSGLITSFAAVSAFVPPAAIIAGGGTVIGLVVWSFVDGIRSSRRSRHGSSHTVTDSKAPSQNSSYSSAQNSETDIDRCPTVRGLGQFDGFESEASKLQKDTAADVQRRHIESSRHAATFLIEGNEPTRTCGTAEIKDIPSPYVEDLPADTTKSPVPFCPEQEYKTEPGNGCSSGVEEPKIESRPCGNQGQTLPGFGSNEVAKNTSEDKNKSLDQDKDAGVGEDGAGEHQKTGSNTIEENPAASDTIIEPQITIDNVIDSITSKEERTVDQLIGESEKVEPRKGPAIQYKKPGGYEEALKDFYSLNPQNVRDIPKGNTGKLGQLPDGREVNVRVNSSGDCYPTLEIQNQHNREKIKFRYVGDKD